MYILFTVDLELHTVIVYAEPHTFAMTLFPMHLNTELHLTTLIEQTLALKIL